MRSRYIVVIPLLLSGLSCEKKPVEVAKPPAPAVVEVAKPPPQERVAELKIADAKIELRRRDELSWTDATVGVALFNRDAIRTGPQSFGRVVFKDHSVLEISEKSTVVILDHQNENQVSKSVLELPKGKIRGEVKTDDPVEMVVRTRQGWIKVGSRDSTGKKLDTRFSAVVQETGESEFHVDEGAALYLVKDREQALGSGEKVTVQGQPGEVTTELPAIEPKQIQVVTSRPEPPPETAKPDSAKPDSAKPEPVKLAKAVAKAPQKSQKTLADETVFEIVSPKDKAHVKANEINVTGRMGSNMQVFLNGKELHSAADRQFSKKISLKKGVNLLIFQVTNKKTQETALKNLEIYSD